MKHINENKLSLEKYSNYNTYKDYFISTDQWVVMRGGAGAGKSFAVADKFALETAYQDLEDNKKLKFVVVRKTLPSLKKTCMEILENRFKFWKIPYRINKQENIARIGKNSQIVFTSLNNAVDFEKVKSLTDVDFIWIEEANELSRAAFTDFLKLRLRGGEGEYNQGVLTFNPVSTSCWLYDYFYVKDYDNALKLLYTVDDNLAWKNHSDKNIKKSYQLYLDNLEKLKDQNENLYNTYRLGEWGQLEGIIYDSWLDISRPPSQYSRVYYGLDFGFSVDPAAVIKIYDCAGMEFYFEEIVYKTGLTNEDLSREMERAGISPYDEIFCDSAEPKSIETLKRLGWNVHPAEKGPGSVAAGVDFLKSKNCYIVDGSPNIKKETDQYMWKKNKDGETLPEPIDAFNHALDAIRYAVFTKYMRPSQNPKFQSIDEKHNNFKIGSGNYIFRRN